MPHASSTAESLHKRGATSDKIDSFFILLVQSKMQKKAYYEVYRL